MKINILLLLITGTLFSCNTQSPTTEVISNNAKTLLVETPVSSHPNWVLSKDTLFKDVKIGSNDLNVPVRIKWLTAKDSTDCLRYGYLEIIKGDNNTDINISDMSAGFVACGMKLASEDTTRFETMIITCKLSGEKNGKTHNFSGTAGILTSIGDFEMK